MDKRTQAMNQIIAEFGKGPIKANDVRSKFGEYHASVLGSTGTRIDRGIYSYETTAVATVPIQKVETGVKVNFEVTQPQAQSVVAPSFLNEVSTNDFKSLPEGAYIPAVDPTFVPYGMFKDLLTLMKMPRCPNIYIVGDSGNGKTMMVEQACAQLGRELLYIQVTKETSYANLIGRTALVKGDTFQVPGVIARAMKRGAVVLLDEVDRGGNDFYDTMMNVLCNRRIVDEISGEIIEPAEGFAMLATANTKGRGDESDRFTNASIVNEAFLERFPLTFEHGYPSAKLEEQILLKHNQDEKLVNNLVVLANAMRSSYEKGNISNHITTRRLVDIAKTAVMFNPSKAIRLCVNRFDEETKQQILKHWDLMTGETDKEDENTVGLVR